MIALVNRRLHKSRFRKPHSATFFKYLFLNNFFIYNPSFSDKVKNSVETETRKVYRIEEGMTEVSGEKRVFHLVAILVLILCLGILAGGQADDLVLEARCASAGSDVPGVQYLARSLNSSW